MNTEAESLQEMGPRTEEHDRLEPFVGRFRAEVRLWMSGNVPMVTTGTMINEWVLGSRYLQQRYEGDPVDGPWQPFEGIGYWGYSATSGEFQGFWIDNASTWMQMESGSVDQSGQVWTMRSSLPNPADGRPMEKRTVITVDDRDHHRMESYFTVEGGEEVKSMEITYVREDS